MFEIMLGINQQQPCTIVQPSTLASLNILEAAARDAIADNLSTWTGGDLLLVGTECSGSLVTGTGIPVVDRFDILAIDPHSQVVVIEAKRGPGRDKALTQVTRYASQAVTLTPESLAAMKCKDLEKRGQATTLAQARAMLDDHCGGMDPNVLAAPPRMMIVAEGFTDAIICQARYLREHHAMDVTLVKYSAYPNPHGGASLAFGQVFPFPEPILRPRAQSLTPETPSGGRVWAATVLTMNDAIPPGTVLQFVPTSKAMKHDFEPFLASNPNAGLAVWTGERKPLKWLHDGQTYGTTSIMVALIAAAGVDRSPVPGLLFWVTPDGRSLAEIVESLRAVA